MKCSSLKEYCLLTRVWPEVLPPLTGWDLIEDVVSVTRVSFHFDWKDYFGVRRVDFSCLSLLSFSSALTLAMKFSACLSCKTSCFQVRYSTTPIWSRSMVCRCGVKFYQCILSQLLGYRSVIPQNLSINALIDSPFFCFTVRIGTDTFVSSSKKQAKNRISKSANFLIELVGSFMNHSKAPLRVLMNKRVRMTSFDTTFSIWNLK